MFCWSALLLIVGFTEMGVASLESISVDCVLAKTFVVVPLLEAPKLVTVCSVEYGVEFVPEGGLLDIKTTYS